MAKQKHTLDSIMKLYQETFYIEDTAPIAIIASIIVSYKMKTPPVWLYLIGPSSGGKSQLIEIFSKVKGVTQISDITANTFLSGMGDGSKSLLHRLGHEFIVTMKDFTTILSKSPETQETIISQMREIYDGYIVKYTGNNEKAIAWGGEGKDKGKATFIMAATEAIFGAQDKFSEMGTRAINYVLKPQDRKKTCWRALKNHATLDAKVIELQEVVAEFIQEKMENMPKFFPEISDELGHELVDIADFSSTCRSVVKRDYRGAKSLALSAEYPMRMFKELLTLVQGFIYLNDGVLPDYLKEATFKVALDSIPKQRRLILEVLAKYNKVNKAGIADIINYSPERTEEWIEDLNMFGVVERVRQGNKQSWRLKEEYRDIMRKYLGIINTGSDLDTDEYGKAVEDVYEEASLSDLDEISWEEKGAMEAQEQQANITFENL